jgi:hypothetical protein
VLPPPNPPPIAFGRPPRGGGLNLPEAKRYHDFLTVEPVGRDFDITAKIDGKKTEVKVDPDTDAITNVS